jgi:hypothetical protein
LWPLPFVLAFFIHTSSADRDVADRQMKTSATIDLHDPLNHDRYGYTFLVDKRSYSGWAYPNDKRDFIIGESIVVFYDPTDPAKNSPTDFHEVSTGDLFLVPFCLMGAIGLPLFIFFRRRALSRASPLANSSK